MADKRQLTDWYKENKVTVDRVMNDLRKQTMEGLMHVYAIASKLLQLEYVVSQQDYPSVFSNNYTRVGDTVTGIIAMLMHEWNPHLKPSKVKQTIMYWLACSDLYESLAVPTIGLLHRNDKSQTVNLWRFGFIEC